MRRAQTVHIGMALVVAVVAGCATQTREFAPPVEPPAAWSEGGGGAALPEAWWSSFGDPALDTLVESAIDGSFDLRTAWDRLAQARAIARREGADLTPTLDVTAGAGRSRNDNGGSATYSSTVELGLSAGYEVDLWGRIGSARDAAVLDAAAAEEDVYAAAITLAGDIARRWYEYSEQRLRIGVLERQQRNNADTLEIITAQFRAGQSRAEDVLRQRNLVESSVGDLAVAERQAETIRLQLLALLGRSPGEALPVDEAAVGLPGLGALPGLGVPSELLRRRPDVRSAYRAVQAADRRVAAAVADRYPRVSISASVSTGGMRVSDLFDDWAANLAGNLVQPLLDGGRREAEVDRTLAVTSEAINGYAGVVLGALHEVETALAQERQQRAYLESLDRQFETAGGVVERVRDSYLSGQSEYLNVLDAQTTRQQLELQRLEARRVLIGYRVALARALAGGWAMDDPGRRVFAEAGIGGGVQNETGIESDGRNAGGSDDE